MGLNVSSVMRYGAKSFAMKTADIRLMQMAEMK